MSRFRSFRQEQLDFLVAVYELDPQTGRRVQARCCPVAASWLGKVSVSCGDLLCAEVLVSCVTGGMLRDSRSVCRGRHVHQSSGRDDG